MKRTREQQEQFNTTRQDLFPSIVQTNTTIITQIHHSTPLRPNKVCKATSCSAGEEVQDFEETQEEVQPQEVQSSFWSNAQTKIQSCFQSEYNYLE